VLRSEPVWNMDFSVFRSFDIKEKLHMEIRGEAFNVFNTSSMAPPVWTLGLLMPASSWVTSVRGLCNSA